MRCAQGSPPRGIPVDLAVYVASVRRWAADPRLARVGDSHQPQTLMAAAHKGDLEGVQWCARNYDHCQPACGLPPVHYIILAGCVACSTLPEAVWLAAHGGHVNVLEWLIPVTAASTTSTASELNEYALCAAAVEGRINAMHWLANCGVTLNKTLFGSTIGGGHLAATQWLVTQAGLRPTAEDAASFHGNGSEVAQAAVLEWLASDEADLAWTVSDLAAAAATGKRLHANAVFHAALRRLRGQRVGKRRRRRRR